MAKKSLMGSAVDGLAKIVSYPMEIFMNVGGELRKAESKLLKKRR